MASRGDERMISFLGEKGQYTDVTQIPVAAMTGIHATSSLRVMQG